MEALTDYIPSFLLIFLRAGIVVSMFPFLGSKNIPAQFRIGLAAAMALLIAPVAPISYSREELPALVLREALLGSGIGAAARAVFFAVETAGQVMSNAMGLSIATVFNPEMGQSTEVGRFYGMITMLIFLSMDAHHDLIALFVKSYELLPADRINAANLIQPLLSSGAGLFTLALKISAPVVVTMLIANILLGFLYKAAPQMNVFFVGYPVYLFLGFLVMLAGAPAFVHVTGGAVSAMKVWIVKLLSGGRI